MSFYLPSYDDDFLKSLFPRWFPKDIVQIVDDFLYKKFGLQKEVVNILKKICVLNAEISLEDVVVKYKQHFGKDIKSFFKRNCALIYDELLRFEKTEPTDEVILKTVVDEYVGEFTTERKKEEDILNEAVSAMLGYNEPSMLKFSFHPQLHKKLSSLYPKEFPKDIVGLVNNFIPKDTLYQCYKEMGKDYCYLKIPWVDHYTITPGARKAHSYLEELGFSIYGSLPTGYLCIMVQKSKVEKLVNLIDKETYPEKVMEYEYW